MANYYTRFSQQNHLLVISRNVKVPTIFKNSPKRLGIKAFSRSSGMRMGRYLRSCSSEYQNMVTLTYPFSYEHDGKIIKEHLRRFLQEMRRYSRVKENVSKIDNKVWSTFWFLEFQERGAPHFHLFTTHFFSKKWISSTWYRIVNSEDERHLYAGTKIEKLRSGRRGTCSYSLKYALKNEQKKVPARYFNVGRFWGISGYRGCVAADTLIHSDEIGGERVKRHLELLKRLIEPALEAGRVVEIKRGTTRMYYLKDDSLVRLLLNWSKAFLLIGLTLRVPMLCADFTGDDNGDV